MWDYFLLLWSSLLAIFAGEQDHPLGPDLWLHRRLPGARHEGDSRPEKTERDEHEDAPRGRQALP